MNSVIGGERLCASVCRRMRSGRFGMMAKASKFKAPREGKPARTRRGSRSEEPQNEAGIAYAAGSAGGKRSGSRGRDGWERERRVGRARASHVSGE